MSKCRRANAWTFHNVDTLLHHAKLRNSRVTARIDNFVEIQHCTEFLTTLCGSNSAQDVTVQFRTKCAKAPASGQQLSRLGDCYSDMCPPHFAWYFSREQHYSGCPKHTKGSARMLNKKKKKKQRMDKLQQSCSLCPFLPEGKKEWGIEWLTKGWRLKHWQVSHLLHGSFK